MTPFFCAMSMNFRTVDHSVYDSSLVLLLVGPEAVGSTYTKEGEHDQIVDDEEDVEFMGDMSLARGFGDVPKEALNVRK